MPAIFTMDDDASVLSAVARDLRRHYGEQYRILRSDSGNSALEALRELNQRNDPVAINGTLLMVGALLLLVLRPAWRRWEATHQVAIATGTT